MGQHNIGSQRENSRLKYVTVSERTHECVFLVCAKLSACVICFHICCIRAWRYSRRLRCVGGEIPCMFNQTFLENTPIHRTRDVGILHCLDMFWQVVLPTSCLFCGALEDTVMTSQTSVNDIIVVESKNGSNLVDSASSHTLVSKIKPCMSKYKRFYTVKLRMAHYISYSLFDSVLLLG